MVYSLSLQLRMSVKAYAPAFVGNDNGFREDGGDGEVMAYQRHYSRRLRVSVF